jgi:hypothetical protein
VNEAEGEKEAQELDHSNRSASIGFKREAFQAG